MGLFDFSVLDQPARRLGAGVDLGTDEDGEEDCRAEDEAPGKVAG